MLADVVRYLVCPVCGADLELTDRELRCPGGHTFDIARQGYANLLPGNARPGTADTPEMVRARDQFLGAGHFAALADHLALDVSRAEPSLVLDAGAGTGHYLSRILDQTPEAAGLALDISKHASRRAARAHPRAGAVVADLWRPLPLRDGAADTVVNVFAPRNAAEFHRVLRDDGLLFIVTPSPRHLGTLVESLGLLSIDERKTERTDAALPDTSNWTRARRSTPGPTSRTKRSPHSWAWGPAHITSRSTGFARGWRDYPTRWRRPCPSCFPATGASSRCGAPTPCAKPRGNCDTSPGVASPSPMSGTSRRSSKDVETTRTEKLIRRRRTPARGHERGLLRRRFRQQARAWPVPDGIGMNIAATGAGQALWARCFTVTRST